MLAALLLNLTPPGEDYPNLPQHIDTRVLPISGVKLAIAPNAMITAQARFNETVYSILCVHDKLTLSERNDVRAFVAANKRNEFRWTAAESDITYEHCVFAGANAIDWFVQRTALGIRFRVEVRMITSVA